MKKVIGIKVSTQRNAELVLETIKEALISSTYQSPNIFYSDRGIEYANYLVSNFLKSLDIKQSMSGKGNCYDNAHMESFFHSYKSEFYYHEKFDSVRQFTRMTKNYVKFYNCDRLHSSLMYKTPSEFERLAN